MFASAPVSTNTSASYPFAFPSTTNCFAIELGGFGFLPVEVSDEADRDTGLGRTVSAGDSAVGVVEDALAAAFSTLILGSLMN
jgi:hypothetical protein